MNFKNQNRIYNDAVFCVDNEKSSLESENFTFYCAFSFLFGLIHRLGTGLFF